METHIYWVLLGVVLGACLTILWSLLTIAGSKPEYVPGKFEMDIMQRKIRVLEINWGMTKEYLGVTEKYTPGSVVLVKKRRGDD